MAVKVAINGYGRIGRNILRALYESKRTNEIQVVAINDLGNAETNAHLTQYDTAHGKFPFEVGVDGGDLIVNGDRIKVFAERDPAALPWASVGADIVIESTGISEPMPVAATFSWEFDDGFVLSSLARLDTMVTVIDACTFLPELARGEALTDRNLAVADGDGRNIADLLVDQVEFADVILINKTDLVSAKTIATVEAVARRLNPNALIQHADHGIVPLATILDTGLFDPVLAAEAPGWDEEIANGHVPETDEYGISSMTFRADRPFHPQRLAATLDQMRGLLRSKGFCWIATRPNIAAIWSQAGPNLTIEPAQYWTSTDVAPGQEIVFIGIRLETDTVRALLDSALLTENELTAGPSAWLRYADPLPAWTAAHSHV